MATAFNLTAQINLRGPSNLRPIVADIKRQLGSVSANVNIKLDARSARSIDNVTNRLRAMNAVLVESRNNIQSINQSFQALGASLGNLQSSGRSVAGGVSAINQNLKTTAKTVQIARTEMEEFGKQSYLALKRFAAFSFVTSGIFALTNAITSGFKAFVSFDRELVRLQQVSGKSAIGVQRLANEITNLATNLGVSSEKLMTVATTLAQAGFSVKDTTIALQALAKTDLAPSFDDLTETTEGAIAAMRQFGLQAKDLEASLGSINAVAAAFAVESSDIITAIQRTGGVFAAASKGVSEGKDALNEFIAVFTSVRATTRESAETIATGLRTIFTRIQRAKTIEQLKEFGVNLQDLEGKFVGPYEAIKRLSAALNTLDPRDVRFSTIVEELGGFRQIGKVIPLIQQFATAQQALGIAQRGQNSLTDAQVTAQQSLANQLAKVREQFLALIRDVGKSTAFQGLFKVVLGLASGLISLASAFKPILPILAIFGAIKGASALTQFGRGFFGSIKRGGGAGGIGSNLGSTLSGNKERERVEATSRANDAIRENTSALRQLTTAIQTLNSRVGRGSTLSGGGKVLGFNKGGLVPGNGGGDTVPAYLEGGEIVMNRKAVQKYGAGNLLKMNKYAQGGPVTIKELESSRDGASTILQSYNKKIQPQDKIQGNLNRKQINFNDPSFPINWNKIVKDTDTRYKQLKQKSKEKNIDTFKLFNQASSEAFEIAVQQIIGGTITSADYPVDIVRKGKNPTEVKFTKKPVSDKDLLSKLYRYRYLKKSLNRYPFTNNIDDNPPINIGTLDIVEMGPGQKEMYNEWYASNKQQILKQFHGGKIQKFVEGSPGGIRVPKGRGKTGSRGARNTFKELTPEEMAQLRTSDLLSYGRKLARSIFTTGGAGMAVGHEFVEVPKQRITPELQKDLVNYAGKTGFWREKVAPFGRVSKSKSSSESPASRAAALEAQVLRHADEVAARAQQWGSIASGSAIDKYLLGALKDPILSDYKTVREGGSLPKAFHNTRLRQAVNKALDSYDDFDYSSGNIDKLVSGMAAKRFADGGLVQQFMTGGTPVDSGAVELSDQEIRTRLGLIGGRKGVVNAIGVDRLGQLVKQTIGGSYSGMLLKTSTAMSRLSDPNYRSFISQAIQEAEASKIGTADKLKNITNQALSNYAGTFGGAGMYQDGKFDTGKIILVPDPKKKRAVDKLKGPTSIDIIPATLAQDEVMKQARLQAAKSKKADLNTQLGITTAQTSESIAKQFGAQAQLDRISESNKQSAIEYVSAVADALDVNSNGSRIFLDFDRTLAYGADNIGNIPGSDKIDLSAFRDKAKVKKGLDSAELSSLSKRLIQLSNDMDKKQAGLGSELLKRLFVISARPADTMPIISQWLNSKNLKIPSTNFEGVGQAGLSESEIAISKAEAIIAKGGLEQGSVFIDDNIDNLRKARELGIISKQYGATMTADFKRETTQEEGLKYQDLVRQTLASYDPNLASAISINREGQSLDFPNGLGPLASTWFDEPRLATVPTDVKRTITQSKVIENIANYLKIAKGYAFGGKTDGPSFEEVKKQILEKYPAIDFRISKRKSGFGYMVQGGLSPDQRSQVNFASNLADLIKVSEEMAHNILYNYGPHIDSKMLKALQKKAFSIGSIGGVGNGVLAKVSNGEAFVPPNIAKKIGYSKLDKMNQADRNGMKGFAGGGISVFKGPGSGTSDSIGPISVPEGSYIIREKATKALGLHKHGGVIRKFADGGRLSKEERKKRKEAYMTQQRGGVSREEAHAIGMEREDFGGAVINDKVLMEARQTAANKHKERVMSILGVDEAGAASYLADTNRRRSTMSSAAASANLRTVVSAGQQNDKVVARRAEQQSATEGIKRAHMDRVADEVRAKYEQLFKEEKAALKAVYKAKLDQVHKEGGDTQKVIDDYASAVADLRKSMSVAAKGETTERQAQVPAQIQAQQQEKLDTVKQYQDPWYMVGEQAGTNVPDKNSPFNFISSKASQQKFADDEFIRYKAAQSGTSETAVKRDLAQQIGKKTYENEAFFGARVSEASSSLVTRRDTAMKIGASQRQATEAASNAQKQLDEAQKAAKSVAPDNDKAKEQAAKKVAEAQAALDAASTQLADANSRLTAETEAVLQQMIALRPDMAATTEGMSKLSEQAKAVAQQLATGDLQAAQQTMVDAVGKLEEGAARNIALIQTAKENNIDEGLLRRQFGSGKGAKMLERQQFAQSREGQRFGVLAEMGADSLSKFSQTKVGQGLGKGADFISGKGGAVSQFFANKLGGIIGVGAGVSTGAQVLKNMLPKSTMSNPNAVGAIGALGGAGSGAAIGAQMGSFAGPVGTLIGGIGGAVIGGINGFFKGKNEATMRNALEKVTKSAGDLDEAFKKLETNANDTNFGNVQKAFGEMTMAGKEFQNIALGSSFTGENATNVGGTALAAGATGAAIGALVGSIVPVIGTAIGAAVGGVIGTVGGAMYAMSGIQSNREEAITNMVGGSQQRTQAVSQMVGYQLTKKTSSNDLDQIMENIKNGTNELSPTVQQYAESMSKASGKTVEAVMEEAKQTAALDAYMQKRKQAGATDEQIAKELSTDKGMKNAIKEGKEAIKVQDEAAVKQAQLAMATKQVTVATENLIDVYRRVIANAERFGSELNQWEMDLNLQLGDLGGNPTMGNVNRQNEAILKNPSAYSMQEVMGAANNTAGMLGNTTEAKSLASNAGAAKILQDQLPAMLRNAKSPEERNAAVSQIKQMFKDQGLESGAIDQVMKDIEQTIINGSKQDTGTLLEEIDSGIVSKFSQKADKGLEAILAATTQYNNVLQKAKDIQQQYNQAILQSNKYLRQASQIRLNAELQLKEALGGTATLQEMNKPFDTEVASMTSGLVNTGFLEANNANDPFAIVQAIGAASARNTTLQAQESNIKDAYKNLPEGAAGDAQRQALNQAQIDNIKAMGANKVAIDEGRQALEKLATDGSKAANALKKIQEEQQAIEGFANFAQNVFTAEPQQLADMELKATALNAAMASGPEFMQSRFNRQQAHAGLEQAKGFLLPQEYRDMQADLLRKDFESQGYKGSDVVKKIGGKEFTLDELIKRVQGGASETDPNVIAYREATQKQIDANLALSQLESEKSDMLVEALDELAVKLTEDFPNILAKAVADAAEAAETKPETKTEEKPKTEKQNAVTEAKSELEARKTEETDAKTKEKDAKAAANGWMPERGAAVTAKQAENKRREATAARTAAEDKVKAAEAGAQKEQEANDARVKAEAEKKAEEKRRAEKEGSPEQVNDVLDESSRLRGGAATRRRRRAEQAQQMPQISATYGSTAKPDNTVEPTYGSTNTTAASGASIQAQAQTATTQAKQMDPEEQKRIEYARSVHQARIKKAARLVALAEKTVKRGGLGKSGNQKAQEILAERKAELESAQSDLNSLNKPTPNNVAPTIGGVGNTTVADLMTPEEQKAAGVVGTKRLDFNDPETRRRARLAANVTYSEASRRANPMDLTTTAPVPVTRPTTMTPNGQPPIPGSAGGTMNASVFSLDPASLKGLNTFNTNFGSYVDKLVKFKFPTIPDKINLVLDTKPIEVQITGASAFALLDKRMGEIATALVTEKVNDLQRIISQKSGGQLVPPPEAQGQTKKGK